VTAQWSEVNITGYPIGGKEKHTKHTALKPKVKQLQSNSLTTI